MPDGRPSARSPRSSIVIPTLGGDHLRRCLAALERQEDDSFEIVVVDNGSGARGDHPGVRVVELPDNRGFAGAANAGAAAARGEYLVFLNDDTEADPDWLAELVACAERHPAAASIASKVLRHDDPTVVDGAGDSMTRSLKAFRRGAGERDGGGYDREEQVFSASGTACLWRSRAFHALGGFDESFFAYYEDVDLGFRARNAGYECWYAPRAVVRHVGGVTSRRVARADATYSMPNRWATTIKNAPSEWLLRNAGVIVFGELLLWGRVLRDRRPLLLVRYLAIVWARLPGLIRARRAVQRRRVASYRELVGFAELLLPPSRRRQGY